MIILPKALLYKYDKWLVNERIDPASHSEYKKWLRYYLDFCKKHSHPYLDSISLNLFATKLASKAQSTLQISQALNAVNLYFSMASSSATAQAPNRNHVLTSNAQTGAPTDRKSSGWGDELTKLAQEIQLRHYSPKTLSNYSSWVKKFCTFTQTKDPALLVTEDVKSFLTWLATERKVAASTQNQAFNALLFFYRHVLGKEFGKVEGVVRAKRRNYIPVVLSRPEIDTVVSKLEPPFDLVVKLLYGCGLRISECLELRVSAFNLHMGVLTIYNGKGGKDRTVPLPQSLTAQIEAQLQSVRSVLDKDLAHGHFAGTFLPNSLERKYPSAPKEFTWQWFFPAKQLTKVADKNQYRRYHLHVSHVNKAIKKAAGAAALTKRVTAHTFRHSFASHLLQANYDIRTIQQLLGHSSVQTTMIYTHTLKGTTNKEPLSPLDF